MTPFILSIELATPIIPSPYTTLDALLAVALYRQHKDLTIAHNNIPLRNSHGVWHGSSLIHYGDFLDYRELTICSTLQRDISPFLYAPTGEGDSYKNTSFQFEEKPHDVRSRADQFESITSEGLFFYGYGDGDHCKTLIENNLFGIGQKTNQGHGQIRKVHLTPINHDFSLYNEKGEPMRPIPNQIWRQLPNRKKRYLRRDVTGWKPPYWEPSHRAECVVPALFRRFTPP
jgi:hypothetical protein